MSYIDLVYPRWNESVMFGLYQMNRAALASRWDIVNIIIDFYVQQGAQRESEIMRSGGLTLARMYQRDDIAEQIDELHGIDDLETSPAAIYYQYTFGRYVAPYTLMVYIQGVIAESLMGFVHPNMRRAVESQIWWYDIELNRPKVAAVIRGNEDQLPYLNLISSATLSTTEITYEQALATTYPTRTLDASFIFNSITRARFITGEMINAASALASRFNLLLPSDSNPMMIEHLPNYVNVVESSPVRDFAIEISRATVLSDDIDNEYILINE